MQNIRSCFKKTLIFNNFKQKFILNGIYSIGKQNYLQRRSLYLHEYQSMNVMKDYSVKTPVCIPATTPSEAEIAAKQLLALSKNKNIDFVVKAQVLAGGRGLGYFKENGFQSGVHICTSPEEVKKVAAKMLNQTLITKQTGEQGKICNKVLVTERFYIRKERYLAIILDRETDGPVLLGSSVGGTNIEDIAEQYPESIIKMPLDLDHPPTHQELVSISKKLGFADNKLIDDAAASILGLYHMFIEKDCLLVEVNPFAETHDGRVLVCDAKINFDDNSEYRQTAIFQQKDKSQYDQREIMASKANLNYVGLNGNIGCMVNGAGLAMSTMDLIQFHGGTPANFLDVGGGADDQQVIEALQILQNDINVSSVFVNIFGGIMRCDIIARGLINASQKITLTKPLVVRLEGTNKHEAEKLLNGCDVKTFIIFEGDFNEAARKAVQLAAIVDMAKTASIPIHFT